jgi:MOSC domain-containing protein YiiM
MSTGKVLNLYMTMPDLMRAGHRMECDSIECDENGIIGDINYDDDSKNAILLLSQKSYDIIYDNDLFVDKGVLLENIFVDIDINHLKAGSLIDIGEATFEVVQPCMAFKYLYALSPELPELLENNRGLIIKPLGHSRVEIDDSVEILKVVE